MAGAEDEVKITHDNKTRCPVHGEADGEYEAQDPAPCGCAWVWDEKTGRLIAVPSWK